MALLGRETEINDLFHTAAGVRYRYARGHYYLATGEPEAALAEFEACADFMLRRGIDLPGLAPWRIGAGRALLRLGRPQRAATLAKEQLAVSPLPSHTRGSALRLLAATTELTARPTLLEEAARHLAASGDQWELAGALTDLAAAYQESGDSSRARTAERRALRLRMSCGAEGTPSAAADPFPVGGLDAEAAAGDAERHGNARAALSESERRVAALAARGMTNREISSRLYITVSTVEQHLTRVYRKVGVARRVDLPTWLAVEVPVRDDPPRVSGSPDRRSA